VGVSGEDKAQALIHLVQFAISRVDMLLVHTSHQPNNKNMKKQYTYKFIGSNEEMIVDDIKR